MTTKQSINTLSEAKETPKHGATVSDTKKDIAKNLTTNTWNTIQENPKYFNPEEWVDQEKLWGFDQKTYEKIVKEKGAKAASEYAAAAAKKPKEEKKKEEISPKQEATPSSSSETKPEKKTETKPETKKEEKKESDNKSEEKKKEKITTDTIEKKSDKKIETKPEEKKEEKKKEEISPKQEETPSSSSETKPEKKTETKPETKKEEKKKEKKSWGIWKAIKSIPKQTKNLISYPIRTSLSTLKYITFDWYNHGLGKKELGSQWKKFKKKFAWNYKKESKK